MIYNSEKEYLDEVENCLKENGCKTWREVIPDGCESWDKPYRVDLVFYRDDFGYVGVEAKNLNSLGAGGKIYDAIKQIDERYRKQTYFKGNIISRWSLLIPIQPEDNTILIFLRAFLGKMDIELLEYTSQQKWRKSRAIVGAMTKNKIEIGGESTWK